jgi:hypothetical protein
VLDTFDAAGKNWESPPLFSRCNQALALDAFEAKDPPTGFPVSAFLGQKEAIALDAFEVGLACSESMTTNGIKGDLSRLTRLMQLFYALSLPGHPGSLGERKLSRLTRYTGIS